MCLSPHRGCDPASCKDSDGKTPHDIILANGLLSSQEIDSLNKQRHKFYVIYLLICTSISLARARDKSSPEFQMKLRESLSRAVQLFNNKPIQASASLLTFAYFILQGLEFMQKAGLLGNDSEDVADFLLTTTELNKAKIGEFIGGR